VRAEAEEIRKTLPPDLRLENSYDISQFIEESLHEVYRTLGIAIALVVVIIFLFLGSFRAVLDPDGGRAGECVCHLPRFAGGRLTR
jgi:multidrug efflux pump